MERTKNILTGIGIAVIILLWWGWSAQSDYAWSKLIIEEKRQEGWVVGTTQANFVDIMRPWTIFKRPVVRIAFVKPSEFIHFDDGLVLAQTLWVNYTNMSRTEENTFKDLFDCKNNKTAFVDDKISISELDPLKLEWQDNTNISNVDIAKIVCR